MTIVTREHLAGLELVKALFVSHGGEVAASIYYLDELIAQASAAPEQEAVAWLLSVEGYKDVLVDNYQRALSEQEHFLGRGRTCVIRNLYTHADPSEVERLRADKAELLAKLSCEKGAKSGWSLAHQRVSMERDQLRQQLDEQAEMLRSYELTLEAADVLRKQLAEAHALLRDADNWVRVLRTQFGYIQTAELAQQIAAFLSATAHAAR